MLNVKSNELVWIFSFVWFICWIFLLLLFIVDENDELIAPGCTSVYLKALRQGYVIVTARYKYKDINIKATVTVAAYIPLKVNWNVSLTIFLCLIVNKYLKTVFLPVSTIGNPKVF